MKMCAVAVALALLSVAALAQVDRDEYANRVEALFLKHGYDAYVSVVGAQHDTLRVRYILMNRPLVYQLMSEGAFDAGAKLGFRKLLLEGHDSVWRFYWDGTIWQSGKPPEEAAAEKQKREREAAAERARRQQERERQRKLDELVEAQAEERERKEMAQPCPDGTKRKKTSYGSYCATAK